jgi:hypothetical protein
MEFEVKVEFLLSITSQDLERPGLIACSLIFTIYSAYFFGLIFFLLKLVLLVSFYELINNKGCSHVPPPYIDDLFVKYIANSATKLAFYVSEFNCVLFFLEIISFGPPSSRYILYSPGVNSF